VSDTLLLGCDFSSAPTRRKPNVLAWGALRGSVVSLTRLQTCDSLADTVAAWGAEPAWVGGFDLPFGLPRELVETLGWPTEWSALMDHYQQLTRPEIRDAFAGFCAARPVGGKFAHRQTDVPAGSSPSMKWVNPPVAYMLHAGVPLLRQVAASFPGIQPDSQLTPRIALEAYPALLAREAIDKRSYKSDDVAKHDADRLMARKDIITRLEAGTSRLKLRLRLTHAQRDAVTHDGKGDALDAVLCLMQAAWALVQHQSGHPCYGLPEALDPLEGWIVTA
jgi:hypothetical protein